MASLASNGACIDRLRSHRLLRLQSEPVRIAPVELQPTQSLAQALRMDLSERLIQLKFFLFVWVLIEVTTLTNVFCLDF